MKWDAVAWGADVDFLGRTSLHVSVAGWALLLLTPCSLVRVGALGNRLDSNTGIQLRLWMPDPIALALLSLSTSLGMHVGAGRCQRLSGRPQVRGRGPIAPPVPWHCLRRWKRACTCSSQAPTAAARVLCSGSLAGSGPRTAACSTSPHPSACSTSLRGEQRRGEGGSQGPRPFRPVGTDTQEMAELGALGEGQRDAAPSILGPPPAPSRPPTR